MIPFFSKSEGAQIVANIKLAEQNTSGEIRVHIEAKCKGDIMVAATKTFKKLNMDKTVQRNGVLIFVAPERKEFVIMGDEGINKIVPPNFWQDVRDLIQTNFKAGNFVKGISEGIELVGEKLKAHFPHQHEADINELSDDISYGNE
jgi:uncharacterized membrane protein